MNNQEEKVKLPFWEVMTRTITYIFTNFEMFLKLSSIWFLYILYEIFAGYPMLNAKENISLALVSFIITIIATTSISVSTYRGILLKEDIKIKLTFGIREIKYLGYTLIIFLIVFIPLVIAFSRVSYVLKSNIPTAIFEAVLWLVLSVAYLINVSRILLIYPAVSIDNKEFNIKDAFRIGKGNSLRIFGGLIVVKSILYLSYFTVLKLLISMGLNNTYVKIIYVSFMIFVSYFETFIRACFFSHVYQYLMYFEKDKGKAVEETASK